MSKKRGKRKAETLRDDPYWREDYIVQCSAVARLRIPTAHYKGHDTDDMVAICQEWMSIHGVKPHEWTGGQIVVDGHEIGMVDGYGRLIDRSGYQDIDAFQYLYAGGPKVMDVQSKYLMEV